MYRTALLALTTSAFLPALWAADAAKVHSPESLAVGKVAPEITGEDLNGKSFKLSDYRGKPCSPIDEDESPLLLTGITCR